MSKSLRCSLDNPSGLLYKKRKKPLVLSPFAGLALLSLGGWKPQLGHAGQGFDFFFFFCPRPQLSQGFSLSSRRLGEADDSR